MTLHEAIFEFEELIVKAKDDLTPIQYGIFLGRVLNEVEETLGDTYVFVEAKKGVRHE